MDIYILKIDIAKQSVQSKLIFFHKTQFQLTNCKIVICMLHSSGSSDILFTIEEKVNQKMYEEEKL